MKLKPSDQLKISETILRTRDLWDKQADDKRARFIAVVTMVETLVFCIADERGHRHAWEWMTRLADELMNEEEEINDEPR